jgi:uncharacterized protein YndB with AHSA1/START domain
METTKITIQARISANRQKVWDYYTQASHITKWNFASPDWHCPSASNDMKVGGKYIARMEAKDAVLDLTLKPHTAKSQRMKSLCI